MTEVILLLVVLVVALAGSAFFSGAETGTYCLNRVRLRVASERGQPGARTVSKLMQKPEQLVITTLLGTNVCDYVVTGCLTALLLRTAATPASVELYVTLIAAPVIMVFGGIIPKDWFRREADRLMVALGPLLAVALRITQATGMIWLLQIWTRLVGRIVDPSDAVPDEEVLPRARATRMLQEGALRGGLTPTQREMMNRVLSVSSMVVGSVMVPRQRSAMVSETITRDDFLRVARMAHFSRIPVYRGDPRRVVGIVNVFDVLTDEAQRSIRDAMWPPLFIKASDPVPAAIVRMQGSRQAMAIVTDATGHCVGLCTMKDLVEEIVGDLEAW